MVDGRPGQHCLDQGHVRLALERQLRLDEALGVVQDVMLHRPTVFPTGAPSRCRCAAKRSARTSGGEVRRGALIQWAAGVPWLVAGLSSWAPSDSTRTPGRTAAAA